MKVHLRMLGCRLNQSEIDTMARQFQQQGHEIVQNPADADEIIVNTCAVTSEAVKSGRKLIRDLHRQNETASINVTGCHAQIAPDAIKVLPGVARVVDNQDKETLVSQITGHPIEIYDSEPFERNTFPGSGLRTRAFIKVQDGCENACTFCVTTVARGDGRSRTMDEILHEVRLLQEAGYQEIILTGVHLGSYGYDFDNRDGLLELTRLLLNETDIPRLRLSSLEPWNISAGFFDLWQNPRLQPHLHLPLQSGCDATLKRMRRNTSQSEFRALMQSAREAIPDVRITSDVIVGFPGETAAEFADSEAFIHEMAFNGLHVFRYSIRPGTPAARMRGQVAKADKKARSRALLEYAAQREQHFAAQYIGTERPVLWEHITGATDAGFINTGYTDNYIRVQCIHPRVLSNLITPARFDNVDEKSVHTTAIVE
ncbi:MAG: tRNA (N(6)-L-threonylcarbamoyladenosine(37)-C(2))-methylthiotransferase MtaB [Aggregatilineales bacterium]